jgi:hypothetical protein
MIFVHAKIILEYLKIVIKIEYTNEDRWNSLPVVIVHKP